MKRISVVTTMLICILCLFAVYSVWVQDVLSGSLIRLHIIANSNSDFDQQVKLSVRDEILAYAKENQVSDAKAFEEVAEAYLKKTNAPYGASASYEQAFVPKKMYKSISLPQGYYNCLKVTLGDGMGENWWCVAYPPLCYTESMFGDLSESGKDELEKILNGEIMQVIASDRKINLRFKIVDELQRLIDSFNKNSSSGHFYYNT